MLTSSSFSAVSYVSAQIRQIHQIHQIHNPIKSIIPSVPFPLPFPSPKFRIASSPARDAARRRVEPAGPSSNTALSQVILNICPACAIPRSLRAALPIALRV
jgi:hypothetical protein